MPLDERAHRMAGARVHAKPTQCGKRQHSRASLRVGLDQQVSAVAVAKRKLGQADDEVPFVLARLVPQPPDRGVDVLGTDRERLAHDLDVPGVATSPPGGSRSLIRRAISVGEAGSATRPTWIGFIPANYLTARAQETPRPVTG